MFCDLVHFSPLLPALSLLLSLLLSVYEALEFELYTVSYDYVRGVKNTRHGTFSASEKDKVCRFFS